MAFFAIGDDDPISAWEAEPKKLYQCLECLSPVRVRRNLKKFPHFYHVKTSPSCRLYSKSEDHLILQLELKKMIPDKEAEMEKPLPSINRISDLLWEKEKIAFEIQCSNLTLSEAKARTQEYKTAGYDVVWILDDRIFNKAQLRPAEEFFRSQPCYFAAFRRQRTPFFYDQFEIFQNHKRVKKGDKIQIAINKVHAIPKIEWPKDLPTQIKNRIVNFPKYFEKDLLHKTLAASYDPTFALSIQNWAFLERGLPKESQKAHLVKSFFKNKIAYAYVKILESILKKIS